MTEDTIQDAPIENTNVIALRRAKVESMRAAGKNLYGRRVDDLTHISEIREKYSDAQLDESSGAEVPSFRIAGRLVARRVMGKATFADLATSRMRSSSPSTLATSSWPREPPSTPARANSPSGCQATSSSPRASSRSPKSSMASRTWSSATASATST